MPIRKVLTNTHGTVVPMRDIFMSRRGYLIHEIDVDEDEVVDHVSPDGIVMDRNGEPRKPRRVKPENHGKPTPPRKKKSVTRKPTKKKAATAEADAEADADIGDILDGLDNQ